MGNSSTLDFVSLRFGKQTAVYQSLTVANLESGRLDGGIKCEKLVVSLNGSVHEYQGGEDSLFRL